MRVTPFKEYEQGKWIKVTRKKPSAYLPPPPPLASKTIFISNLPVDTLPADIKITFRRFGEIENITIPILQKPNLRFRYAFIRYEKANSVLDAISSMNGLKLEGKQLKVQQTKFDKKPITNHPYQLPPRSHLSTQKPYSHIQKSSLRDQRTYREATMPNPHQNHKSPTPPTITPVKQNTSPPTNPALEQFQEEDPQPDFFNKNPSKARITSSKILGEATVEARELLIAETIEEEFALVIEGSRNLDNKELFDRSLMAVAQSSLSSNEILNCIIAEGVLSISIKPLGGLLHLIIFENMEEKLAMMESNWLDRWFIAFRQVNDKIATQWREITLNIYGVPLTAWNYENFHNIGSIFGRVLSVEYSNFDKGRILLITDCLFKVNCRLWIKIGDDKYPIFVYESEHPQKLTIHEPPSHPNSPSSSPSCMNENVQSKKESDDEARGFQTPPTRVQTVTSIPTQKTSKKPSNHDDSSPKPHDLPPGISDCIKSYEHLSNQKASPPPFPLEKQDETGNFNHIINIPTKPSQLTSAQYHTVDLANEKSQPSHKSTRLGTNQNKPPLSPRTLFNSPKKSAHNSPINITNRFGPLYRSKISTSLSSLDSGPLFPPGYEFNIPSHEKSAQIKRRHKKIKKSQMRKLKTSTTPTFPPQAAYHTKKKSPTGLNSINTNDIIAFASKVGMTFNGPQEELRARIDDILRTQKADWVDNQP